MSEFHRRIEEQIPRLRRYAGALTRNRERADDLVQDTLGRALVKEKFWQPGTNLRAWLFTMMHNQNVNNGRRDARNSATVGMGQIRELLFAMTDPRASRKMFELERALAHVLRRYGRNSGLTDRHGPLTPVTGARCSSQALGFGGTAFRSGTAQGGLMAVTAALS